MRGAVENMAGKITTHALDLAKGKPAAGLRVELWGPLAAGDGGLGGGMSLLKAASLNDDGRPDEPLAEGRLTPGVYELRFFAGEYFGGEEPQFLEMVPVRFAARQEDGHYHVPLLLSPGGYSTYRGS